MQDLLPLRLLLLCLSTYAIQDVTVAAVLMRHMIHIPLDLGHLRENGRQIDDARCDASVNWFGQISNKFRIFEIVDQCWSIAGWQ